jgi:hypothetical protein
VTVAVLGLVVGDQGRLLILIGPRSVEGEGDLGVDALNALVLRARRTVVARVNEVFAQLPRRGE